MEYHTIELEKAMKIMVCDFMKRWKGKCLNLLGNFSVFS